MDTASGHCQNADAAPDTAGHSEHRTQRPLGCVFACVPLRTGREQPGHGEQPGHSENWTH
eukprot:11295765-Alexandrium_andersonii.AAC.1